MSMLRAFVPFVAPLAFLVVLLLAVPAFADGKIFTRGGEAISGYDPVAYFTEGKPVEGKDDISFDWNGATWTFASVENREMFAANPEKYAPQYGGYCAYGASKGAAAKTEPDAWSIIDGKLYLNYSDDVKARWLQDIPGYIKTADENWPEIESKL